MPEQASQTAKWPDLPAKCRFMVIDDNTYMTEIIAGLLKQSGARDIVRAESAEIALRRCTVREPFSAFICDFNMRPMNGVKLLQSIRSGQQPHIPRDQTFVLVTGHGEADVVKAAKALDVNGYIVKPLASQMFITAVGRGLQYKPVLRSAHEYASVPIDHLGRLQ